MSSVTPLSESPNREPAALEQLARHRAAIARYLRYLGARPDGVDDLVQETFLHACSGPFEWRSDAAGRAWLRTIARNALVSSSRRRGVPASDVPVDELAAAWEQHCGDDDGEAAELEVRVAAIGSAATR